VAAADPVQEVVRRVSTSGGRTWGVNIGRYPTEYKARQVLLQTALTEMSTLDDSLRKVVRRPTGFDANFMGMTRDSADLACRRLQAKQISCFMIGPG
jgi:D-alanyl-D-alanine carboxypeptidase